MKIYKLIIFKIVNSSYNVEKNTRLKNNPKLFSCTSKL